MTVEITQKAEVTLNWLKDPITKKYIKSLLLDEQSLCEIANLAMQQAVSNGIISRTEDEIKVFSELKATRILLSKIPYESFQKQEKGEDLTEEDIKNLEEFFEQLPN